MLRIVLMRFALACLGLDVMPLWQDEPSQFQKCRWVTSTDLADPRAPSFGVYASPKEDRVLAPKLDLTSNPIAKEYRTVLRLGIKEGPNYAGHYRVVVWGCGSSCTMFVVVNLKSGRVISPPGFTHVSGVFFAADDFLPLVKGQDGLLRYESTSKLLVVIGDLEEDESREGAFYFVLENDKLRLLHSTEVKKNCANADDSKN
jgi:hypothetical protein